MARIQQVTQMPEIGYSITYEQVNTLIAFLRLWAQMLSWTRELMVSTVGNLDNKTAVVNQLFTIPTEMYNVFRIFYGSAISQQFLNIVTNFITNQWQLTEALKEGDRELVDEIMMRIYQNADGISALLAETNVYWDEEQWKSLLYQYIRLQIDEMVAMLSGNYERDIEIYKRWEDVSELIGSYMARGIIARSAGVGQRTPA